MNKKNLKNFAAYARAETDKLGRGADEVKSAFISMLINRFAAVRGLPERCDDSIIPAYIKEKLSSDISSGELSHIENIGWIFQYFVDADRAQTVDAIGGGDVADGSVTAATQVFTPEWIVAFLADNSLGRIFAETGMDVSGLKYLFESRDGNETARKEHCEKSEKLKKIENTTFFDPCCGSGHILVYAFDLFMNMYAQCALSHAEAVRKIAKNICGADIDPHAVRLAVFQLEMKALEYGVSADFSENIHLLNNAPIGSLSLDGDELFTRKFDVVCTNPPYLKKFGGELKEYLNSEMKPYSKDLFTAFMYRGLCYCKQGGYMAYMTPSVWLYLVSHRGIRNCILDEKSLCVLIQPRKGAFFSEAMVDICAFVVQNIKRDSRGVYIDIGGEANCAQKLEQIAKKYNCEKACDGVYERSAEYFGAIDGRPMAYAAPECVHSLFGGKRIGDVFTVKQGMTTGCNKRFLRYWFEVPFNEVGFSLGSTAEAAESGKRWFPYNKGGRFRKWYGNNEFVVMYADDGREMKDYTAQLSQGTWVRLKSRDWYFRESVTWSFISSSYFGVRYSPHGSIFDVAGSSLFGENLRYVLGFLCSSAAFYLLGIINPSMNYQIKDIKQLPYRVDERHKAEVERIVGECVEISKSDWDESELSFDFGCDPVYALADGSKSVEECIAERLSVCAERHARMRANEERLNRIFAEIYGMESVVGCEVPDDKITLRKADEKICAENLVSYLIGRAFGRYSDDGVIRTVRKELTADEVADFVEAQADKRFCRGGAAALAALCTDGKRNNLRVYIKRSFVGNHKRRFHGKGFYFKSGKCIEYRVTES